MTEPKPVIKRLVQRSYGIIYSKLKADPASRHLRGPATAGALVVIAGPPVASRFALRRPDALKSPPKNRSVITLVRQLLNDAEDMGIKIHWIKVRGHSGDRGNDQADAAATMGLKGYRHGASDIAKYLRERGRNKQGGGKRRRTIVAGEMTGAREGDG